MFSISKLLLLSFLTISSMVLFAEPWGKDADLVSLKTSKIHCSQSIKPSPLAKVSEVMILFHKKVISPADGPRSHFRPNSSQYTLDAIRKYGFFKGFILGCDRLMRENNEEWIYPTIVNEEGMLTKWNPVK